MTRGAGLLGRGKSTDISAEEKGKAWTAPHFSARGEESQLLSEKRHLHVGSRRKIQFVWERGTRDRGEGRGYTLFKKKNCPPLGTPRRSRQGGKTCGHDGGAAGEKEKVGWGLKGGKRGTSEKRSRAFALGGGRERGIDYCLCTEKKYYFECLCSRGKETMSLEREEKGEPLRYPTRRKKGGDSVCYAFWI